MTRHIISPWPYDRRALSALTKAVQTRYYAALRRSDWATSDQVGDILLSLWDRHSTLTNPVRVSD